MARTFAVVTDSTADLAPALAAEHDITVVPLSVMIGDQVFADGALSQQEFFKRMRAAAKLPTTSQPPVGAFVETYERLLQHADEIVSVHISDKLSGTIESARQAAAQFSGRVHVFDSRNLSWGLTWQVMEAANAAREGLAVAATLERLERARERVRLIVTLDSLDNLAKGGRIGAVSAFMGSMLNLKVALTVDAEGAFQPLFRDRGEKAALQRTIDWVAEQVGSARHAAVAVGCALSPERAERLAADIRERLGDRLSQLVMYEAGSVICAHTGTGWGVAVLVEDETS